MLKSSKSLLRTHFTVSRWCFKYCQQMTWEIESEEKMEKKKKKMEKNSFAFKLDCNHWTRRQTLNKRRKNYFAGLLRPNNCTFALEWFLIN
jgi:hypothetical protein